MSWQQIGDAARNVAERVEPKVLKITVHRLTHEPLIFKVPVTKIEQEPLVFQIKVESAS